MKNIKIIIVSILILTFSSCSKLTEKLRGTVETGGSGGAVNVAALLQGAYDNLGVFDDQALWWAASEHTTDECIGPTRGPDWDDNGVWRVLHNHRWDADHGFLTDTYRNLGQLQFAATTVLDNGPSPQQAAEARFIRAFAMWAVLDGWDQVPFRATTTGDLTKTLPETKKGAAGTDFLIAELNAALPNLPDGPKWKANKNAARALLMKLYLNKGAYTNRTAPTFAPADMNQVISLADAIINSTTPAYALATNYYDNFAPDNSTNTNENIWATEHTNATGKGGNNQSRWFCGLHYNHNPSGWNGFTTLGDFYDKFTATDKRRGDTYPGVTNVSGLRVGMLFGQQFDQSGTALQDRRGNPLSFTKAVLLKETGSNLEITGIRVMKYPPDYAALFPANNDMVIFRLADVLLMKAEAILRGGTGTVAGPYGNTALAIVNFIRLHPSRNAGALVSVDLNAILDERGRELYWEAWRRNDLIRFGRFLAAWQEKPASGSERLLFPIPNEQLAANPNLTQNPGY